MANRNWVGGGKVYSMHKEPVMLDCQIIIGAAGAVVSFSGAAIASVSLVSTGIYKIVPQDNYAKLFTAVASMQSPVAGLSGVSSVEVQNAPSASVSILGNPSLTVKTLSSGIVAAPALGSAINVLMIMSNSSILLPGE